jgi:hypothetical protein
VDPPPATAEGPPILMAGSDKANTVAHLISLTPDFPALRLDILGERMLEN